MTTLDLEAQTTQNRSMLQRPVPGERLKLPLAPALEQRRLQ